MWRKKTSIPLDQVIKKSCDTVQRKWKQAGWPPNSQSITLKSSSSLPLKSFFKSLYTITKPPNKLKATPNAVDLAMDLLLSSQARNHKRESAYDQFETTNLRQHHSHQ